MNLDLWNQLTMVEKLDLADKTDHITEEMVLEVLEARQVYDATTSHSHLIRLRSGNPWTV